MGAPAEVDVAVNRTIEADGLRMRKDGSIMVGRGKVDEYARACLEVARCASDAGFGVGLWFEAAWVIGIRQGWGEVMDDLVGG